MLPLVGNKRAWQAQTYGPSAVFSSWVDVNRDANPCGEVAQVFHRVARHRNVLVHDYRFRFLLLSCADVKADVSRFREGLEFINDRRHTSRVGPGRPHERDGWHWDSI
jgi:hypothetical protein